MGPGAGSLDRAPGEDRSMAVTDLRWLQREEPAIEGSGEVCVPANQRQGGGHEPGMSERLQEAREGGEALVCKSGRKGSATGRPSGVRLATVRSSVSKFQEKF